MRKGEEEVARGSVTTTSSVLWSNRNRKMNRSSGLEESLMKLVNDHNLKSSSIRQRTEKAKKEAMKSGIRVSELLVESVNGGVQDCFLNQKRIEMEIRSLSSTVSRFRNNTDQWLSASRSLNSSIKEIGDFENWIKVMLFDCKSITSALHNIHHSSSS